MNDHLHFLKSFARNPMNTGAIAPSSQTLAKAMIRDIDLKEDESIIEFGPGTGPFTLQINQMIAAPKQYMGIELNPTFHQMLSEKFTALNFIKGSASDAPQFAKEHGIEKVKAIICGLPFASLPPKIQDAVMDAIDALLEPGCEFRTFQYVHAYPLPTAIRYRKRMSQLFGKHEKSKPVMRNLPPAYVLKWTRQAS